MKYTRKRDICHGDFVFGFAMAFAYQAQMSWLR